jgi:hypothetical protein
LVTEKRGHILHACLEGTAIQLRIGRLVLASMLIEAIGVGGCARDAAPVWHADTAAHASETVGHLVTSTSSPMVAGVRIICDSITASWRPIHGVSLSAMDTVVTVAETDSTGRSYAALHLLRVDDTSGTIRDAPRRIPAPVMGTVIRRRPVARPADGL